MEKEYNVILKKGVDYDQFTNDMVSITSKDGIPNRIVEISNSRLGSYRQTHYNLTDTEANEVKNHSDVLTVEIPPEQRDDVIIGHLGRQSGTFTKNPGTTQEHINYALLRSKSKTNNYGTGTELSEDYLYNLDGTGVDVVIQDSGIEANHPEWEDANGISRLKQVNWSTVSGLGFTQSSNHYRDYHGHGTHVASTVAGKTFGWAKNADIYVVKLSGLEGSGDSGTGITTSNAFDCIKLWHRNKPIDSKTGFKRPTIVNMSWGYLTTYNSVSEFTYRGQTHTGADVSSASQRETNYGLVNYYSFDYGAYVTNVRIASVDTDVEELVDEGIHVTIAAGNRRHKIDISTGVDYNNSAVTNSGTKYYHRGSSPSSPKAVVVGSLDNTSYSTTLDQKATYSEAGPGVDIFAHGTYIMAASSNINQIGGYTYPNISGFKQVAISGTSMAAPQVAGVATLICQANPGISPADLKKALTNQAGSAVRTTSLSTDYGENRSILGAEQKVLLNKFGSKEQALEVQGSFDIPLTISF